MNGSPIEIRRCRTDEVEAVLAFWQDSGAAPSHTDTTDAVTRLLERSDSWLLLAEADGLIVGSLIAAWDGWRGSFYRLAVLPDRRRTGVGSALVQEGEARLRVAGADRLSAIVLLDSDDAVGFWEAAGYERHLAAGRFTKSC